MTNQIKRVLIVEDEKLVGKIIAKALQGERLEKIHAASLKEAGEILEKGPIDLIILDRILPDGDGVDLMNLLRETPAYKRIPVLILSGKDRPADQVDGLDLGADDYMTKPFVLTELKARVDALLRRAEKF